MPTTSLTSGSASRLDALVADCTSAMRRHHRIDEALRVVASPYRINPLGAHVDHQGGNVLARTIDQYTLLAFAADDAPVVSLSSSLIADDATGGPDTVQRFTIGEHDTETNWLAYAMASVAALHAEHPLTRGIRAHVLGTLVGAGLSSSASVILAYLSALAEVNDIDLSRNDLVQLCRRVENGFMGLNNGIQDQMSVAWGRADALSLLDVDSATATHIDDPATVDAVRMALVYSGFSRELISSGFNTRVAECREAAAGLQPGASRLGDVDPSRRDERHLHALPDSLALRARHFYSEIGRVASGTRAWAEGDWSGFGALMSESCRSSIEQYQCGTQPMIDLHQASVGIEGVYGSRFCGGGYGGCLIMLCEAACAEAAASDVLARHVARYPEKAGIARAHVLGMESAVRVLDGVY